MNNTCQRILITGALLALTSACSGSTLDITVETPTPVSTSAQPLPATPAHTPPPAVTPQNPATATAWPGAVPTSVPASSPMPPAWETHTYHNAAQGITGALVYTGTDFAQLIEGRHESVEVLWRKLQADPRHHDVLAFLDEPCERAWFETWRMGYLYDESLGERIAEWRALKARLAHVERDAVRALLASADAY